MPKGSKKSGARSGHQRAQNSAVFDFTVDDFANADPARLGKGKRMSKGQPSVLTTAVRHVTGEAVEFDDLAWDERNLSDYDLSGDEIDVHTDAQQLVGEEAPSSSGLLDVVPKIRKKTRRTAVHDTGRSYPLDLWYLLGRYIEPEVVSKFALICRSSHLVVHSANFWLSLYKRHYKNVPSLSATLRPQCIERVHGLRGRVIRTLFHMYLPFQKRLLTTIPFENDPSSVEGAQCTMMWYQHVKTTWHFYFRFHRANRTPCPLAHGDSWSSSSSSCRRQLSPRKRNHLLEDADIHHNTEEDHCVLKVVSTHFISLPPSIMGQFLAKSFVSVGHVMSYHKLKLVFASQYAPKDRNMLANGTTTIMDPVLNTNVLPWWDPKYPNQPA